MPGKLGHTERKRVNIFVFTLHEAIKQNVIPNSQVVKETINIENLINLTGP